MSWNIEKIFTDNGSELSTGALNTHLGVSTQSAYDGRFMWVACTNGIAIYEFWGGGNEQTVDEVDDLLWSRYLEQGPLRKLKLVTFVKIDASTIKRSTRYVQLSLAPEWTGGAGTTTVSGTTLTFTQKRPDLLVTTESSANATGIALSSYWIAKSGNKMIVSQGASFSRCWIFDIATQRMESTFQFPFEPVVTQTFQANLCANGIVPTLPAERVTANSNLVCANNKVWFVNAKFDDTTQQRLYSYNLSTQAYNSQPINVRPGTTRTWLADGLNGFIYATDYNGVSVSRYSTETGILGARIRTNAHPTKIWTDENRRIMVSSYEGMLTLVDWDDDGVHNDYSTENKGATTIACFSFDPVDTTKIWFAQAEPTDDVYKVTRYDLSTKQQLETSPIPPTPTPEPTTTLFGEIAAPALITEIDTGTAETIVFEKVGSQYKAKYPPPGDWHILGTGMESPDWMVTVPTRTYTHIDGTNYTQRPYMFICDGANVRVFALDYYLVRTNFFEVNGQGAVVGGALEYFGEGP